MLARLVALIAVIAVLLIVPDPDTVNDPAGSATPTPTPSASVNPKFGVPEPSENLGNLRPAAKAPPIQAGRRAPRGLDAAPPLDAAAIADPEAAATSYALQSTNWSADTLLRQTRRLQRLSSGPLARQLRRGLRDRRMLDTVRRDDAAQVGRLVDLAVDRDGSQARARVLMSEQLYGASLGNLPARSQARYSARLQKTSRGWTVTRWVPEP